MKLSKLIKKFMKYEDVQVMLGNHAEDTRKEYKRDLDHLYSVLGPVKLKKITPQTVQAYYLALAQSVSMRTGEPLSPHTINKRLRSFRRVLNFAVEQGWMKDPPKIEMVKAEVDLEEKTIPIDKLQKILEHAYTKRLNRERDTFIVVSLSDFGPRIGEIASLTISNVNEEARKVTINRKGGRIQTIPVSDVFLAAYRIWMNVRPDCNHDFVLCSSKGDHEPMTPAAAGQAFRRMSKNALDGESWGPHSVRHMWITIMMNRTNTPIKVIQDIVGHMSIRTTEQYAKHDLEAQRQAIAFNQMLKVDLTKIETDCGLGSEDYIPFKSGHYATISLN